jgi:hypothetical protein
MTPFLGNPIPRLPNEGLQSGIKPTETTPDLGKRKASMVEHEIFLPHVAAHHSRQTDERTIHVFRFLSVNPFLRSGNRLRS